MTEPRLERPDATGPAYLSDDRFLDSLRQIGDPPVDEVVAAWFDERQDMSAVEVLHCLHREERLPPADRSPVVRAYLDDRPPLPDWCDLDAVRRGQEFFQKWQLLIATGLLCASLPEAYAGAHGVQVLHRTGRFVGDPKRRIFETAYLVGNVMQPGGTEVGAQGWSDARRVRLMHAAIRHLVRSEGSSDTAGEPWDPTWGVPINQEDLLGTLWTFALATLRVLRRSGVSYERQEAEDYLHAWFVVGHLMGIATDLIPVDLDAAEDSFAVIKRRLHAPSEEGQELARKLLEVIDDLLPLRWRVGFPATLVRHHVGDEVADLLAIPARNWTHVLIPSRSMLGVLAWANRRSWLLSEVSQHFGRQIWKGLVQIEAGRPPLTIPSELPDDDVG